MGFKPDEMLELEVLQPQNPYTKATWPFPPVMLLPAILDKALYLERIARTEAALNSQVHPSPSTFTAVVCLEVGSARRLSSCQSVGANYHLHGQVHLLGECTHVVLNRVIAGAPRKNDCMDCAEHLLHPDDHGALQPQRPLPGRAHQGPGRPEGWASPSGAEQAAEEKPAAQPGQQVWGLNMSLCFTLLILGVDMLVAASEQWQPCC